MGFFELLLIAVGLSMDAFAVAVCAGLTMPKVTLKKPLVIGLYFGVFQAGMPLIGYLFATRFADKITAFDHWVAFIVLSLIGGKMIVESFKKEGCPDRECPAGVCVDRQCPGGARPETREISLAFASLFPLALATSIDALAVGISFAFLKVDIAPAVMYIGFTTFILSMAGVVVGHMFGMRYKSRAERVGGVILILLGVKTLFEHLGFISL